MAAKQWYMAAKQAPPRQSVLTTLGIPEFVRQREGMGGGAGVEGGQEMLTQSARR